MQFYRERGHRRSGYILTGDRRQVTGDRRQWRSGWPTGLFLVFVRDRQVTREGGDSGCHVQGRRQRRIILGSRYKQFWKRQGCDGNRNPAGVAGARAGQRGVARTLKDRGKEGNIGVLGPRQLTPRWADDPVWSHNERQWRGCRVSMGMPPLEGH